MALYALYAHTQTVTPTTKIGTALFANHPHPPNLFSFGSDVVCIAQISSHVHPILAHQFTSSSDRGCLTCHSSDQTDRSVYPADTAKSGRWPVARDSGRNGKRTTAPDGRTGTTPKTGNWWRHTVPHRTAVKSDADSPKRPVRYSCGTRQTPATKGMIHWLTDKIGELAGWQKAVDTTARSLGQTSRSRRAGSSGSSQTTPNGVMWTTGSQTKPLKRKDPGRAVCCVPLRPTLAASSEMSAFQRTAIRCRTASKQRKQQQRRRMEQPLQ